MTPRERAVEAVADAQIVRLIEDALRRELDQPVPERYHHPSPTRIDGTKSR